MVAPQQKSASAVEVFAKRVLPGCSARRNSEDKRIAPSVAEGVHASSAGVESPPAWGQRQKVE